MSINPAGMASLQSGLSSLSDRSRSPKDTPEKIHEAAKQFESLLIGQILKAAQSSGQGWAGESEDAAGASTMDFASDYLARSMAAKGGLGLSQMISKSLEHAAASNSSRAIPIPSQPDIPSEGR